MLLTLLALCCLAGLLWLRLDYEARLERAGARALELERRLEEEQRGRQGDREATRVIRDRIVEQGRSLAKAKHDFLEAISHELRTPLTGVLAALEILDTELPRDCAEREWVHVAWQSSLRMQEIVAKSEEMVQLSASLAVEANEIVPLEPVLKEVFERVRPLAREREVRLAFSWVSTPIAVPASPRHLTRLIELLAQNAVMFTSCGSEATLDCVPLLDEDGEDRIAIELLDRGKGVPSGEEQRIFEPFHQCRGDAHEKPPGLGLGLTICRSLAASLGTRLQVLPRDGGGSCFRFELPALFEDPSQRLEVPGSERLMLSNDGELREVLAVRGAGDGFQPAG
ncbi:MAG: HAMP domain-containing sensor histidine kinase [Planctomycetota bacterium]